MQIVIADTRNQVDDFAVCDIERYGYTVKRWGLPYGDFALADNIYSAVDIKSSSGGIVEISRNICSGDHERLRNEIRLAAEWGGDLCFLVANSDGITSVDELEHWTSPLYKSDCYVDGVRIHKKGDPFTKVAGTALMKAIKTMCEPDHYAPGFTVNFVFCKKEDAGNRILRILRNYQCKRAKECNVCSRQNKS